MNTIKKRLTAVMAGGAIATAGLVAPQAMAAESTEMELRILQMEDTLRMMRGELEAVRSERGQSGRFDALEERMGAVETADMPFGKIFFRSGWARNNVGRGGEILTDANADRLGGTPGANTGTTGNALNGDQSGWYFGAGIEHGLSRDLFGLMDDTHFMAEITINYKDHGSRYINRRALGTAAADSLLATGTVCSTGASAYGRCDGTIHVTEISITASPKIRFAGLADSLMGLEPWVIPGGFGIFVMSPPSEGATYIAPGVVFGGGLDYTLYKNITIGASGKYNHVMDQSLDGTRISGFDVGGTLGFKF